jgi:hypothetical protein
MLCVQLYAVLGVGWTERWAEGLTFGCIWVWTLGCELHQILPFVWAGDLAELWDGVFAAGCALGCHLGLWLGLIVRWVPTECGVELRTGLLPVLVWVLGRELGWPWAELRTGLLPVLVWVLGRELGWPWAKLRTRLLPVLVWVLGHELGWPWAELRTGLLPVLVWALGRELGWPWPGLWDCLFLVALGWSLAWAGLGWRGLMWVWFLCPLPLSDGVNWGGLEWFPLAFAVTVRAWLVLHNSKM